MKDTKRTFAGQKKTSRVASVLTATLQAVTTLWAFF